MRSFALRLVLALLLLAQPLAARGLAEWLPCPAACSHCEGATPEAEGCGCEPAPAPDATAGEDCRCVHAPDPAQPVDSSRSARVAAGEALAVPPSVHACTTSADSGLGFVRAMARDGRPPPELARLCVWRE